MAHKRIVGGWLVLTASVANAAPNAQKLVEQMEFHTRGNSLQAQAKMKVVRGGTTREMEMRIWTQGKEKAVVKLMAPPKDRDVANLRLDFNLWQYLPNLERTIKIAPSMMLQSWMGSDFTNDDLVKTSSLSRDYTQVFVKETVEAGTPAYLIECKPKPDAPVTWGKVMLSLARKDSTPLKQEFYTEDGEVAKVLTGEQIRKVGAHVVPTLLTMRVPRKNDQYTVFEYVKLDFDQPIPASTFTQDFLRKRQ